MTDADRIGAGGCHGFLVEDGSVSVVCGFFESALEAGETLLAELDISGSSESCCS